jgi:hypothetical protein
MAVLNRGRTRNLPDNIGGDFYRLCGVGEAVHGRVTFALVFLGLIDDQGAPQDTLKAMARAPEPEYKELLAATVREAYGEDFLKVDPGQDSQAQVIDFFRRYEPRSQTSRMVMLFLGLCREAGIPVKDVPRDRKMASPSAKPVGSPRKSVADKPRGVAAPSSAQRREVGGGGTEEVVFGISQADIGVLDDNEFNEVWAALGKVARARSRAARAESPVPADQPDDGDGDAQPDEEGG